MEKQPVFDDYEISPCWRIGDGESSYVETCAEEDAQFWTLYGHISGEGVQAIGDFCSREFAEETYYRITGQPFTGSYEVAARLKQMHAAPRLMEACRLVVERWESGDLAEAVRLCQAIVEQATGNGQPADQPETDIHALLASRRQIAVIWGIEDVQGNRPDLDDEQAWEVFQSVKHQHDCNWGITWQTLEVTAAMLFPEPDEE